MQSRDMKSVNTCRGVRSQGKPFLEVDENDKRRRFSNVKLAKMWMKIREDERKSCVAQACFEYIVTQRLPMWSTK